MTPQYADNLKTLRGFNFDSARDNDASDARYRTIRSRTSLEFGIDSRARGTTGFGTAIPTGAQTRRVISDVFRSSTAFGILVGLHGDILSLEKTNGRAPRFILTVLLIAHVYYHLLDCANGQSPQSTR